MDRKTRVFSLILVQLALLLAGCGYALFVRLTGIMIPCIFKKLTGLSCPGCGNTHVVMSFLRLKPVLSYNYCFFLEAAYIIYVGVSVSKSWLKQGRIHYEGKYPAIDITVLIIVILWWVLRNILNL